MAKQQRGLGKGIGALLGGDTDFNAFAVARKSYHFIGFRDDLVVIDHKTVKSQFRFVMLVYGVVSVDLEQSLDSSEINITLSSKKMRLAEIFVG